MRSGGFKCLSLPSSCNHRCVVIRVTCEGWWVEDRGRLGPLTPGTGHRMDNREPQSRFLRVNRARHCNNNKFTFFPFCIPQTSQILCHRKNFYHRTVKSWRTGRSCGKIDAGVFKQFWNLSGLS